MIINKTRIFLLLLCGAVFLGSCSKDMLYKPGERGEGENAQVTFSLRLPGAAQPESKSMDLPNAGGFIKEEAVHDIDVLVFDQSGKLHDMAQGRGITDASGGGKIIKQFDVTLRVGNDLEVMVFTNSRALLAAFPHMIQVGVTEKTKFLEDLVMTYPSTGWNSDPGNTDNYTPIPMWGVKEDVDIYEGMTPGEIGNIPVSRLVARIDVSVNGTIPTTEFELTSVSLYYYNTKGLAIPGPGATNQNNWTVTEPYADEVSLPTATTANPSGAGKTKGPVTYTTMTATNALKGMIYAFESEKGVHFDESGYFNNTCLVIGGKYSGSSTTTYYRVDFNNKKIVGGVTTYEYLRLLRNHRYQVVVKSVGGPGKGGEEEALNTISDNIEVGILDWGDGSMGDIEFDGRNFLSVTPGVFDFYKDARLTGVDYGDNVLYIKTDYKVNGNPGASGWKVDPTKIYDAATNLPVTWLTLSAYSGAPKDRTDPADEVKLTFAENPGPTPREVYFFVTAGRLDYKVVVSQSMDPAVGIYIYNAQGKAISELVFPVVPGATPVMQPFKVVWNPKTADVNVTNTQVGANPFPASGGLPTHGDVIYASSVGNTGEKTYNITPPMVSAADVADDGIGDPFLDRLSQVGFMTTNGMSLVSNSLFVRQIYYNLKHDAKAAYILESSAKDYTINIRSNTQWKVSHIVDDDDILLNSADILTKSGGNNTGTGDPLTVRIPAMASDASNHDKKAYIHLVDPTGRVTGIPPIEIWTVGCGAGGVAVPMKLESRSGGYRGWDNTAEFGTDAANTYLTHMYNGKCWMVQNSREGTPRKYGYQSSGPTSNTNPHILDKSAHYYYPQPTTTTNACPIGWHLPDASEHSYITSMPANDPGTKYWKTAAANHGWMYDNTGGTTWDGTYWGNWQTLHSSMHGYGTHALQYGSAHPTQEGYWNALGSSPVFNFAVLGTVMSVPIRCVRD